MTKIMEKIAVVTGASRGLGFGTAQALAQEGFQVFLLGRNLEKIAAKAKELKATPVEMDLLKVESVERAAKNLAELCPDGIDVLVNNAGVLLDRAGWDYQSLQDTVTTNALAPMYFTKLLYPLLAKRKAHVVNVSSGMGQLSEMGPGYAAYRISKTAMNAFTKNFAQEWRSAGIKINSVCPGWVKTDMGGAGADRELSVGVASILFATQTEETGGFFRDGQRLDW
jgi:NAD(P)-dependent dehydrogenase (short-subunit alcohol dehydrogenase family)